MTMRRILYLDLVGGAAGDMLMAALVDAVASLEVVRSEVMKLDLSEVSLDLIKVSSAGLAARRMDVRFGGRIGDGALRNDNHSHPHERREHEQHEHGHTHAHADHPTHGSLTEHMHAHVHEYEHTHVHAHPHAHEQEHAHSHGNDHEHDHEHARSHDHAHLPAHGSSVEHAHAYEHEHAHSHDHAHLPAHGSSVEHEQTLSRDHEHGPAASSLGESAHRPYRKVRDLIERAELHPEVRRISLAAFRALAEAESKAHAVPIDDVMFHEVGSDDALVDVVGTAAALVDLGVDEVVASPAPMGRGLVLGAHGPIPVPAPATLTLLEGVPIEGTSLRGETVTPTGAALLRTLAQRFGPLPSMVVTSVGVGAGRRSWPDRPNIVRALVGQTSLSSSHTWTDEDCVVEANIDDMSPELLPDLEQSLFAAGALDVWSTPIHMKKGRIGVLVSALGRRALRAGLVESFFAHSTTLGVRAFDVARARAPRKMMEVETSFGTVRVKISERPDLRSSRPAPEHDDCEALARKHGVPVLDVVAEATQVARARLSSVEEAIASSNEDGTV